MRDAIAAGITSRRNFADQYGSPTCIVKLGCWGAGSQLQCGEARMDEWNRAAARMWEEFASDARCPDSPISSWPFMNQPPGSLLSSAAVMTYGRAIQALRRFTQGSLKQRADVARAELVRTGVL